MPIRRPDGYTATDHETIGSDIQSVLNALTLPQAVLGASLLERVRAVNADAWYPIEFLIEVMDVVEQKVGKSGLSSMGRRLFKRSHQERVLEVASSAGDIIFGLDAMYHHANRGHGIGGWKPVMFQAGKARVEKRTPHHCVMEEGILAEALMAVGVPGLVSQSGCLRAGDAFCTYEISAPTTTRWQGSHPYFGK